jgi:hypothetical protein
MSVYDNDLFNHPEIRPVLDNVILTIFRDFVVFDNVRFFSKICPNLAMTVS